MVLGSDLIVFPTLSQESKELTSSTRWRYNFLPLLFISIHCSFCTISKCVEVDFLKNCSLVSSKAVTMFEDDERFKAVEKEADREDLFRTYLVDLQKKVMLCAA